MSVGPVIIASIIYGLLELIPLFIRLRKMSHHSYYRLWLLGANIPLAAAYLTGNDLPKDQSLPLFLALNSLVVLYGLIIWVFIAYWGLCNQEVQKVIFRSSTARILKRMGIAVAYLAAICIVYWLALFINDPQDCARINCRLFVLLVGSKSKAYSILWSFSIFSSLSIFVATMYLVALLAPRLWPGSSDP